MKKTPNAETIFARASGAGRAGVAVYRVSGPAAFSIAKALCGRLPVPKRASLRLIREQSGDPIDEGLLVLFRGPASFTGEDVAEFHLHASPAVEAALYEALTAHGARPAEAGEFSKRALVNGRLDLAEIEGLADLLDAETRLQRKQALGQLGGRLSAAAEGWRGRLLAIMAPLEADIDFPDEEDIPAAIAARAGPEIDALIAELKQHEKAAAQARAIRDGVKVAIIGAPNAGKSSLLNFLSGSERAIVAPTPGTTRDVIEARLDLGGILVSLFDTAGLRENADNSIEIEGMRRTRMTAEEADIRVLMIDAAAGPFHAGSVPRETEMRLDQPEVAGFDAYGLLREGDFVLLNKCDLVSGQDVPVSPVENFYRMSVKTGEGAAVFLSALAAAVAGPARSEDALLTRARHTEAVARAIGHLEVARRSLAVAPELAAEDVRLAARALGGITGAVGVEDVLAAIFSSFCIGK
ncbi:MAG: tRNA uridine-5-carboxymethylaminomethyl(34) synthesis GTPase MnmE [Alphaproteobacteria bacterium RIFCSPHIGHO2_12_FULL_63_12]|nr:MAG: tRNA uridine-5-carboxymethylaminomethyl(34) synthesis GTPase MnmE [Alphaproteobacteria bacterium RIFCSPHIGHO2_12_FULL_63_12]